MQKIIVQATSGVGPDTFDVYGGPPDVQAYVEAGILWDITDRARAGGFSMDGDLWPGLRDAVSYQGRQYTYPANAGTSLLLYNKNVFDRLGVPYPSADLTWEDFFALTGRFPHDEADPRSLHAVTGLDWKAFFNSVGGEFFSADGTRLALREGGLREAFQMHHDLLFKYRAAPRTLDLKALSAQGGWGGSFTYFAEGQFAMLVSGRWSLIALRQAHQDQENRLRRWEADPQHDPAARPELLRIGVVMLPHFAGQPRRYSGDTRAVGINAYSPHREEALQFLQYLAGPEYSRTVNAGVDSLPGNPKYAADGVEPGDPDLSEIEVHHQAVEALAFARVPRLSPFLLTNDVLRVLGDQINRMEVSPELPVDELLEAARQELDSLLRRNLERDPRLKAEYDRRVHASAASTDRGATVAASP